LKADQQSKAATRLAIAQMPMDQLVANPQLMQAAVEGGRSVFKTSCVQCHGSGASGAKGYPNLNDDDWLWGGDIAAIHQTISHGIRQPGDEATRISQMPAFGRDGLLEPAQINDVAVYVRLISGQGKRTASAVRGEKVFADNCAVCHGADGKGNRALGAPNLTDVIWLYGGDTPTLVETITNSRQGVMPAWTTHFDPVTVKMLAAYVYSLGGGEKQPLHPAASQEAKADGQP
jgi:cytochrome c oxidase cbb3-type subunit 3